ncbi:MAG: type II toxin-antitoxin system Phd/YefM family antitoxin [Acidobacteria bacterium]|nr:type II toxin-antitoxin system Phd/YefM family antitoxin [Acidobacteriota bacterium]
MKVYTYSEARRNLAAILEEAKRDGAARIRRRDGQTFAVSPEQTKRSPLDVAGVDLGLTRDDIVDLIRQGRRDN